MDFSLLSWKQKFAWCEPLHHDVMTMKHHRLLGTTARQTALMPLGFVFSPSFILEKHIMKLNLGHAWRGGLFIFSKHASEGGIELIVLACLSNKPHWLCRFLAYKNQWVIKKWYQVISKARGEKGAKLEKSFSQLGVVKNVNNLGFDTRETGFGEIGGGGQGGSISRQA